jgi:hypothetical protein
LTIVRTFRESRLEFKMSYLECHEFESNFRKLKEQIKIGAEMIKKIGKSLHRDDEYFGSAERAEFKKPLEQNLKELLRYDQGLGNYMEAFRSTLFQVRFELWLGS